MNSISRRSLLIRSGAVLAGAQLPVFTRLWAANFLSKPGVQMYMVAADYKKDPAGTLRQLAAIGYGYVEAFTAIIPNISEFRKMIADAGLGCPSGHFSFGFEETEKALDQAAAMGVRYAISSVLPPEPPKNGDFRAAFEKLDHMTADDFRRQAALANRIGQSAHKRGMVYAYHNHNFEFRRVEGSTTGYDIFLKETDPRLVKLEVDAGWMAAGGADPAALIRANADRVRLLHFKDFSTVTPPVNELGQAAAAHIVDLGTGVAPLKAAYEAARMAGVRYFIVDHDPPFHGQTTMEAAKVDYDYVAKLMAS
ncbi:MAG TPA: sugar phosphate isomerase/epimerase [Acidobacteriaceae bacterium]|jgi:sugar phosphate isomerase/epimerase|nr:sugar phosphate isomerase/epimerase [Acidobacteriaceae bacterium]